MCYSDHVKPILLCLHGWGGSKESFTEIREELKREDIEILIPDLPGFGEEAEPKEAWTIDDYAAWVETYVATHTGHPRPISVLGHSHGGRIALKMAADGRIPIKHLYLCAAAGIRRPWHFKRFIGYVLAKIGKVVLSIPGASVLRPLGKKVLYKLMRVHDYEKASPVMQKTMINVTREDLRDVLPKIAVPTDLFWGAEDTMTPVADAFLMREKIKGSTLHVYQGVRHAVHRAKAADIAQIIKERMTADGLLS
jgi:pimeloyl-ACP methyl ester carboxylesterase